MSLRCPCPLTLLRSWSAKYVPTTTTDVHRCPCRSSNRNSLSIRCVCSLCMSDRRVLYVLVLHVVVPRLAGCLHASFNEECYYRKLHVFRSSSKNVCSCRSMAVGGARPNVRSASVSFSVILSTSVYTFCPTCRIGLRRRFQLSPMARNAPHCPRAHRVVVFLKRLDQTQVSSHEWWASLAVPFPRGSSPVSACSPLRGSTL